MTAPGPASRAVAALTARELRLALRRGENLLVSLVVPAAVLLFFSTVPVVAFDGAGVDALLPRALALAVVASSFVSLGIATAYERHYGVLKRLGGAPLPRGALVVAKITAVVVIQAIQAVVLVGVAWLLLGWRPPPDASIPATAVALLLGTAAFGGLGLAMAGRLRAEATLAVANGVFLALLLVGGILVPAAELPGVLGVVASLLPSSSLVDAVASGLGSAGSGVSSESLALLAAWAIAAVLIAVVGFRSDPG